MTTDYNDRDDRYSGERKNNNEMSSTSRHDVLALIDLFIEQIFKIRKTLLGVSISALVIAPIAIGLSIFLLRHPSFFAILETESEFGLVLSILLGAVIVISSIWLVAGIRQYRSVSSWNVKYKDFVTEKEEIEKKIALRYGLDNNYFE
jgi:hypothetical protein